MVTIEDRIKELTNVDDIRRQSRVRKYIESRELYTLYYRDIHGRSFDFIAKDLGYKNHASAVKLYDNAINSLSIDKSFMQKYYCLKTDKSPSDIELEEARTELRLLNDKVGDLRDYLDAFNSLPYESYKKVLEAFKIALKVQLTLNKEM
jgi:hypothetical protein